MDLSWCQPCDRLVTGLGWPCLSPGDSWVGLQLRAKCGSSSYRWMNRLDESPLGYLIECRAARGTDEDGDGRLQSPWRSSMDRLQGESMEASSPPDSDCSPSNLNTQTDLHHGVSVYSCKNWWPQNEKKNKKQEKNPLAWLHIERRTNTRQERPDLDFPHSETPSPTYTETGDRVK